MYFQCFQCLPLPKKHLYVRLHTATQKSNFPRLDISPSNKPSIFWFPPQDSKDYNDHS